ncbi:MAG: hypothetical protein ACRDL4_06875 [Thermoleophilaceae bacterium]
MLWAVLTLAGVLLLAVAGALLLLGGDGGEDGEPERRAGEAPGPPQPAGVPDEVDAAALRSARALARGFERVTGDRLALEPPPPRPEPDEPNLDPNLEPA